MVRGIGRRFTLVALALLSAAAGARKSDPKAVQTEMKQAEDRVQALQAAQAQMLQTGMAEFTKEKHDCDRVLGNLIPGLFGGFEPMALNSSSEPAYAAVTLCAAETKRWDLARRLASGLIQEDPRFPFPGILPRSEIALGEYEAADRDAELLIKKFPKDPDLALLRALSECRLEKWDACEKRLDEAKPLIVGANRQDLVVTARGGQAEVWFHQGKFDQSTEALQAVAKANPDDEITQKRIKRNAIVAQSRLGVEPVYPKEIPLGVYHLYGNVKDVGPLLTLKLYDFTPDPRQIRVEVDIAGTTEKFVKTKMLSPNQREVMEVTPPLKTDPWIASLSSNKPSQLDITVTAMDKDGEKVLYQKAYPVTLLPRDMLPLSQKISDEADRPTPGFMGAWITPNSKPIDEFLKKAKHRVIPGGSFVGEQGKSLPQVKGIWNQLKASHVSYVADPTVLADLGLVQRTRLPKQVLASTNAQCLEGTLLFASLLEAIHLRPVLVMIPGHAFVGWHATLADGPSAPPLYFVETTMIHDATFEQANKVAQQLVAEGQALGAFDQGVDGAAFMVEVAALRQAGYKPQPFE